MSSLIFNPSDNGIGSVSVNVIGDDKNYNLTLPNTNGTLVSTVNGKTANNNGSVTIDVGVKSVNGVAPDSKGNVAMKVQSVATSDEVVAGTDNTKMMTPLRTKESVQQFSPTDYVTGLSVSGQTVTFTKKNGTTGKITTQDTKYTHPNSGVSAGTYNTVTVNAQGHVTGGNNVGYLPLTGGEILGDIHYRVQNGEFSIGSSTKGARLALNEATRENHKGQVILQADDGTTQAFFNVFPNGDLKFNGNAVDYIVQQSNGVVRYASGLQIVWFSAPITTPRDETQPWNLTYPLPFVEGRPISVSINLRGNWAYSTNIQLEDTGLNGCSGTLRRKDGDPTNNADIYGIAIGYWR